MGNIATIEFKKRVNGSIKSLLIIGNKAIETPTTIPKIKKPIDFNIICDKEELEKGANAVCFNIHTVSEITRMRRNKSKQFNLELKTIDENYDSLIKNTPILIDPCVESLYYKIPWKVRKGESLYVKDGILETVEMPDELQDILLGMNSETYNNKLNEIKYGDLLMTWIDSFITYQAKNNADIIIPPVPLITGNDTTLALMSFINQRARRPILQRTRASPSIYLPLHYSILKKEKAKKAILDYVRTNIMAYKILVIKLVWYDSIKPNKSMRVNYGKFLTELDKIKKEYKNSFTILLLDAGTEGFISLANGVDGYSEPIDGNITPKRGAKTEGSEPEERITHGSYVDPYDGAISFRALLEKVNKHNNGILPCSCSACDKYHGKLSADIDRLEWNISRRSHLINIRRRRVDILSRQISANDSDDIAWSIENSDDRNLVDLLPLPDFVRP